MQIQKWYCNWNYEVGYETLLDITIWISLQANAPPKKKLAPPKKKSFFGVFNPPYLQMDLLELNTTFGIINDPFSSAQEMQKGFFFFYGYAATCSSI